MPVAQGLTLQETSGNATKGITKHFRLCFSKLEGLDISNYEKEEGDIDGPFTVSVVVETSNDGKKCLA